MNPEYERKCLLLRSPQTWAELKSFMTGKHEQISLTLVDQFTSDRLID
jgi:hypothetical protein